MKFLIKIQSDSELITYEAIALAFTLASFDHQVQLYLTGKSHVVLQDPSSRLYGMIQSLELYDIPQAWTDYNDGVLADLDNQIASLLIKDCQIDESAFDTLLVF